MAPCANHKVVVQQQQSTSVKISRGAEGAESKVYELRKLIHRHMRLIHRLSTCLPRLIHRLCTAQPNENDSHLHFVTQLSHNCYNIVTKKG